MLKWKDKAVVLYGADAVYREHLSADLAAQGAQVRAASLHDGLASFTRELSSAAALFGGLDTLICDVRTSPEKRAVSEYSPEEWRGTIGATAYQCWKAGIYAAEYMHDRKDAAILFITDSAGYNPNAYNGVAAACSSGIEMMAKLMASELASAGIRVVCICADSNAPVTDLIGASEYLTSEMASYITGTTLRVSNQQQGGRK